MPKLLPGKRIRQYDFNDMQNAYFACTEEGIPIFQASRRYGIPYTTLARRVRGCIDIEAFLTSTGGNSLLFSEMQEYHLAEHFKMMARYVPLFYEKKLWLRNPSFCKFLLSYRLSFKYNNQVLVPYNYQIIVF